MLKRGFRDETSFFVKIAYGMGDVGYNQCPCESESVINKVTAESPDSVQIILKDGTVQEITMTDMEGDCPKISYIEILRKTGYNLI